MNHSEQINDIAAALSGAQGMFTNPQKNREVDVKMTAGGKYTFTYATLDAIMDMIRPALAANGLAVIHSLDKDDQGTVCETRLLHSSGQWISTWVPVLVGESANAQGWGGAITYARRYGLCSLLAIVADEDDDANAACGNQATRAARNGNGSGNGQASAHRADAWRAIEEAEKPSTLLTVAERVRDSKALPEEAKRELLGEATQRMYEFSCRTVKVVATAEQCESAEKFYCGMWLLEDGQKKQISDGLAIVREELERNQTPSDANVAPAAA